MKDLNLFRQYKKNTVGNSASFSKVVIPTSLIIMFAIFFGLYYYNTITIKNLNTDIKEMQTVLTNQANSEKLKVYNETKSRVGIMKNYISVVNAVESSIEKTNYINSNFLISINSSMPANTFIEFLNLDANTIQIKGMSISREEIAEYQHNLKKLEIFNDVFIENITMQAPKATLKNPNPQKQFSFFLQCEQKGGGLNAAK